MVRVLSICRAVSTRLYLSITSTLGNFPSTYFLSRCRNIHFLPPVDSDQSYCKKKKQEKWKELSPAIITSCICELLIAHPVHSAHFFAVSRPKPTFQLLMVSL